jgi:hypothetical protein
VTVRWGALLLTLVACVLVPALTLMWWTPRSGADARTFDDFITDIRAMNEYNARFVEGIVIFLAVALVGGENFIQGPGLILLLLGFGSGAVAMLFVPLPKPAEERKENEGPRRASGEQDERPVTYARRYWLLKIALSQATVIFTLSAVLTMTVNAMSRFR